MPENNLVVNQSPRRWFRFYAESLNDPKVQRLPAGLFKTWVNLLSLTCQSGGVLPRREDIAFQLRMSDHDTQAQLDELIGLGLLDIKPDKSLEPHNWKSRQYVSDTSADRVRKHREAKKKKPCNVTGNKAETAPDTDTDTESERKQTDGASAPVSVGLPPAELKSAFNGSTENLLTDVQRWMGPLADRQNAIRWLTTTLSVSDSDAVLTAYQQLLASQANGRLIANPIAYLGKTSVTMKGRAKALQAAADAPKKMTMREALNAKIAAREALEAAA